MSQHASHSRGLPNLVATAPEWAPEVDAGLARTGMWIFMGADAMFFVAFFFAFFYLKALNNDHLWMSQWVVHPRRNGGTIIVGLLVVAAVLVFLGARAVAKTPATARLFFWLALLAGVLCVGFQMYEFNNLGFNPQLGRAYPSVFIGLQGVLMVQVVVALLWLGSHIHQATPTGDSVARPASGRGLGTAARSGACLAAGHRRRLLLRPNRPLADGRRRLVALRSRRRHQRFAVQSASARGPRYSLRPSRSSTAPLPRAWFASRSASGGA